MIRRGFYSILYADPPWWYNQRANLNTRFRGGARGYYQVMRTEEICGMQIEGIPVGELAGPDAYLFLWATWPNIQEAFRVIEAWGFRYTTCGFLWVKTNPVDGGVFFGVGHYTKSNTEPCLLAVRGRPWKHHPLSRRVSQVVISPRREHSRKPDEVRERIVELCGDLPRLELFAREAAPGWHVMGTLEGARPRPLRVGNRAALPPGRPFPLLQLEQQGPLLRRQDPPGDA